MKTTGKYTGPASVSRPGVQAAGAPVQSGNPQRRTIPAELKQLGLMNVMFWAAMVTLTGFLNPPDLVPGALPHLHSFKNRR